MFVDARKFPCLGVVRVALLLLVGFAAYCAVQVVLVANKPPLEQVVAHANYLSLRSVADRLFEVYAFVAAVLFMRASLPIAKGRDVTSMAYSMVIVVASGVVAYLLATILEALLASGSVAFVSVAVNLAALLFLVLVFQILAYLVGSYVRRRTKARE